jgi:hypothetical protein
VSAYPGSNKAFSFEYDSIRQEQLLQALSLIERRLYPQVGGAPQNAFCEGQDSSHARSCVDRLRFSVCSFVLTRT